MLIANIIGLSVLAIFFLFVVLKKKKTLTDWWLLLVIFLFACILFTTILAGQGYAQWKYLFQILVNVFFFPVFLTYGLLLLDDEHRLRKSWWWVWSYAAVFGTFLIIDFGFLSNYSDPEKIASLYESPPLTYRLFYMLHQLFVIGAMIWFLVRIRRYRTKIKSHFSYIDPINLTWLRNFTYAYLIIHLLTFCLVLFKDLGLIRDIQTTFGILFIAIVASLFYLSYKGIRHYALADFKSLNDYSNKSSDTEQMKYKSSAMSQEEIDDLFKKINQLFDEEKIYLEPQLRIDTIAQKLGVSTHKVSQTINSKSQKPFYDFVNLHRVEHFKNLLSNKENRKFTILALGIESGFNSKASINRIFKDYVGLSPKMYQKANSA